MSLSDDNSGLVNGFCMESILSNSCLKSSIKKFVKSQTQNVIELEFLVGKKTISMHSSEKGSTFKQSSGVLFFKSKKLSCCLSEFRKSEMDSPDFSLVLKTVLTN